MTLQMKEIKNSSSKNNYFRKQGLPTNIAATKKRDKMRFVLHFTAARKNWKAVPPGAERDETQDEEIDRTGLSREKKEKNELEGGVLMIDALCDITFMNLHQGSIAADGYMNLMGGNHDDDFIVMTHGSEHG